MPLQEHEVIDDPKIETIKKNLIDAFCGHMFSFTMKDMHHALNSPRRYPYVDYKTLSKAIDQLVTEGDFVQVGDFFHFAKNYNKPSLF